MPRGRRRKDPGEAPVDGDYANDVVLNKQKDRAYKWLSADDIPRFKANGFTREERTEDSAHPAYDLNAASGDPEFKVGSLTLYSGPIAAAERLDNIAQRAADRRMGTIRSIAQASGGDFTSQHQR